MTQIFANVEVNNGSGIKENIELEIVGINFELRTTMYVITGTDKHKSPIWIGHGGSIDLAILDLCRNYQREKQLGPAG